MGIAKRRWIGVALAAGWLCQSANANAPVKIGLVMPFSGPAAVYGVEAKQAAELAVDEINTVNSSHGGPQFELVFEDDRGTPQGAVGATQKEIAVHKVNAVIGGMGSQLALAQSSVTNNRMLYVNSAAQADAITEQGNPWLFQINNTTSMNAAGFNKYIVNVMKPRTVAFVGENTEFTKPLLAMIRKDLEAANIQLVSTSLYDVETNDFTSIITKLKWLDPDLVYTADGSPARLVQFWRQARQFGGFRSEAVVPGVVTPAVLKAAGGVLNGVVTADIFSNSDHIPAAQEFMDAFQRRFKTSPGKNHLVVYEAVTVVAAAMAKAGSSIDYTKIAQTMRENAWQTPRGTLTFDDKGRAHAPFFYIQRVKDMQLELITRNDN